MAHSKFTEILNEYDIQLSTRGNVRISDIVEKIIHSNNSEAYIKKIPNKKLLKNEYYISQEECMKILEKGKSKTCKELMKKLNKTDDNTSMISIEDNIFQYEGNKFKVYIYEMIRMNGIFG